MGDAPLRGRLMWFELMTKDLPAAEKFYTNVVGWTITPFAGAGMPYSMFTRAGDVPIAGAMTLPPELTQHGVPPHWGMYVGVEKLEPAAADVARLGGGALSEVIDVPTIGRMQAMRDPQGAAFSIYEPASPPPAPEAAPELGEVSWIELMTSDAPAAMQFYRDMFGWQPTEAMDMGPMGKYHMFGRHLGPLGGMMNKPKELAQVPPELGHLLPGARPRRGGGAGEGRRREDPQRPDGGAGRRSHRELPRPAGRGFLAAREEGGVGGSSEGGPSTRRRLHSRPSCLATPSGDANRYLSHRGPTGHDPPVYFSRVSSHDRRSSSMNAAKPESVRIGSSNGSRWYHG